MRGENMSKYIFINDLGKYESAYSKESLCELCYKEVEELKDKLLERETKHHNDLLMVAEKVANLNEENKKLNEAFKLSCIDNLRDCGILETDYGFEEKLKEEMKYYLNEVK